MSTYSTNVAVLNPTQHVTRSSEIEIWCLQFSDIGGGHFASPIRLILIVVKLKVQVAPFACSLVV